MKCSSHSVTLTKQSVWHKTFCSGTIIVIHVQLIRDDEQNNKKGCVGGGAGKQLHVINNNV